MGSERTAKQQLLREYVAKSQRLFDLQTGNVDLAQLGLLKDRIFSMIQEDAGALFDGMKAEEVKELVAQINSTFVEDVDERMLLDRIEDGVKERKQILDRLDRYERHLRERTQHHFGYPYNLSYAHEDLHRFMRYSINNLGDPFIESNYGVHSREFEIEVLEFFADLWKIPREEYWGYVTCSGTEGNLHGILMGREYLPEGILYCSRESHYSVPKAARMYRMETCIVDAHHSGEMDLEDFERKLVAHKNRPAIINANIGTTVKGAVDDVRKIVEILRRNGFTEETFFIHCDGALFALMLPFVADLIKHLEFGLDFSDHHLHPVTFDLPIASMSVSGHKFAGCPFPSGVQMTKKKYVMKLTKDIEYLNSKDSTIMGSRNGHAPIFLWHTIVRKGIPGFAEDTKLCLRNAQFLKQLLVKNGFSTMLNPYINTVVVEKPSEMEVIRRWQLACEGTIAHVVVMPNVSLEKVVLFVEELKDCRSRHPAPVCVKAHIGNHCLCMECKSKSPEQVGN